MKAVFVCVGEDVCPVFQPDGSPSSALTASGEQQARKVAACWHEPPTLIVTSPCPVSQQTAKPTIARYPKTPVKVWPLGEFSRLPLKNRTVVRKFGKPPRQESGQVHLDGLPNESFTALIQQADLVLTHLAAVSSGSRVYLFSHSLLYLAINLRMRFPEQSAAGLVSSLRHSLTRHPVSHCDQFELLRRRGKQAQESYVLGTYTFA